MDAAAFSHSRCMPARHEDALAELQVGPKAFDGRSKRIVAALTEHDWATVVERDEKNEHKVTLAITGHGKVALERSRRGVDPYIRVTA